jgi:hypothetical protein
MAAAAAKAAASARRLRQPGPELRQPPGPGPRRPGLHRSYPSGYGQTGGGSYRETQHQSYGGQQDRGEQDRQSGGYQSQGSDRYRPMTGDYGRSSNEQGRQGSGFGGQDFGQQQYGSQDRFQDQGSSVRRQLGLGLRASRQSAARAARTTSIIRWRQRQIEELDRDYDEYCREHQSRFENEFSGFRQQRQTKRQMLGLIREHAEVVDESGQHIGTVDKVRGEKIILTKNDPEAGTASTAASPARCWSGSRTARSI